MALHSLLQAKMLSWDKANCTPQYSEEGTGLKVTVESLRSTRKEAF